MFTDISFKLILQLEIGSMNDITLRWMYNSVEMWCRIIQKDEDNSNDNEYECEKERNGWEDDM